MPRMNLFGEIVMTGDDFAPLILDNCIGEYHIQPKIGSRYGYILYDNNDVHSRYYKSGYYSYHKFNECLYVGKATCINARIGRFCAALRNLDRDDENHPFATRYKKRYGENFEGLTVRMYPYDLSFLKKHMIKAEEVENCMMSLLGSLDNKIRKCLTYKHPR